jgi:hypothetical protein
VRRARSSNRGQGSGLTDDHGPSVSHLDRRPHASELNT